MFRYDLAEGAYGFINHPSHYTHEGLVYQPIPDAIMSVDDFVFETGTAANSAKIVVAESRDDALTPNVLAQIESFTYRDQPVTIYALHFDPQTGEPIGVVTRFRGIINDLYHEDDPTRGYTLVAECTRRSIDLTRKNARYRTHEDQQRRSSGDSFYLQASATNFAGLRFGRR